MVHITSRMKIVCNYPTHLKICRITLIHQNILSFFSPLNRSRTSSPVKGLFLPKFCNCVGSSFYYLVLLIAVLFLCREDVKPGPEILLPRDLTEVMVPLQVKHRREETVLVGTWIWHKCDFILGENLRVGLLESCCKLFDQGHWNFSWVLKL